MAAGVGGISPVAECVVRYLAGAALEHLNAASGGILPFVVEKGETLRVKIRGGEGVELNKEAIGPLIAHVLEDMRSLPIETCEKSVAAIEEEYGSVRAVLDGFRPLPSGADVIRMSMVRGKSIGYCAGSVNTPSCIKDISVGKVKVKKGVAEVTLKIELDMTAAEECPHAATPPSAEEVAKMTRVMERPGGEAVQEKKSKKKDEAEASAAGGGGGSGRKGEAKEGETKKEGGEGGEEVDAGDDAMLALMGDGAEKKEAGGQKVDPWTVVGGEDGIDYDKLVIDFGCSRLTPDLISRVEAVTGRRAHRFLRRGIFFAHREMDKILHAYATKQPFYLYTGRGPSSEALHLGHLVPFLFTQYLQEAFGVPLVVQVTDDEKFLFKKELKLEECERLGRENSKDIIACGFDPERTFIFSDVEYIGRMYRNICKIRKVVSLNTVRAAFGFNLGSNIGMVGFPAVQAAPSFSSTFPVALGAHRMRCLIPQAIDQDPYFRVTRDVAPRLKERKPALIHSVFFPALQGPGTKMSASNPNSAIFVTDTPKSIARKINKYAFTGGGETEEEQREKGANTDVDVPYQWLRFFLEDDEELERIRVEYSAGRLLSGEVKQILIRELTKIVTEHQERRAKVDDAVVAHFMTERALKPPVFSDEPPAGEEGAALGGGEGTA